MDSVSLQILSFLIPSKYSRTTVQCILSGWKVARSSHKRDRKYKVEDGGLDFTWFWPAYASVTEKLELQACQPGFDQSGSLAGQCHMPAS
jgi:hypothetical protein